jgi:hypothetical protein
MCDDMWWWPPSGAQGSAALTHTCRERQDAITTIKKTSQLLARRKCTNGATPNQLQSDNTQRCSREQFYAQGPYTSMYSGGGHHLVLRRTAHRLTPAENNQMWYAHVTWKNQVISGDDMCDDRI